MENEYFLHRCITEFMLDTCRYTRTSDRGYLRRLSNNLCMPDFISDNAETFPSGSSAEFYIKPMLPCIGDTDIMICVNHYLAIPAGHIPPTELPDHFQRFVSVFEIIDSHQPGYVYLEPSYVLLKTDEGHVVAKINRTENAPEFLRRPIPDENTPAEVMQYPVHYFKQDIRNFSVWSTLNFLSSTAANSHGPAIQHTDSTHLPEFFNARRNFVGSYDAVSNFDTVSCIRCLLWPPQAADWPIRSRYHGVPNQTIINTVVSNGCDVVGAIHPRCKQDKWMNKHQWRLSFSRAEVTLINSWTPVQQIIYHMLRYVLKREVFSKADDEEQDLPKLSNYHIKTLMLWQCEQKPQSWWSAESSVIKLCSSLIHKLSDWVADKRCQHYFVSNCNIIDHFDDVPLKLCCDLRRLADSSVLLNWFITNYIFVCAQYCPNEVSDLFEDISSAHKLERAVHAVTDWKLSFLPKELYIEHFWHEWGTIDEMQMWQIDAAWITTRKRRLQKLDPQNRDYVIAVLSLHVAYTVTVHSLTEDHLEILRTLFHPCDNDTTASRLESGGLSCIRKAISMATLTDVRSTDALEMLHNEMSKAFLHHSLGYKQEYTYCVVHVLLAALYYKSGCHQTATGHCRQVLNQRDREQHGSRCIGSEYLPQIDESVDTVFGLVRLYQHLQRRALNSSKKLQSDNEGPLAFTTQLLARYLYSICSTAVNTKRDKVKM